jgi:hypothetical protein
MNYVDIEPLQPPFTQDHYTVEFQGDDRKLAVSRADFDRICKLLGTNNPQERMVELTACDDNHRIRVKVLAS